MSERARSDDTSRHSRLYRLLNPKSVAVIGGRAAEIVIRQCEGLGFAGEIWSVNPSRDEVAGRRCYRRIEDLPAPPDAAFIAAPRDAAIAVTGALAGIGAGGAVCYASGFAEVGAEGAARQRRLLEAAGAMPVFGPNCHGFVNYLDRVALWPDAHGGKPVERGAAVITQSGNMGINLTMQRRALPLAALITLGNQARLGISETLEALLEDQRISAVGLHIEGLSDVADFARVAAKALRKGVPIVALKTGHSAVGARVALGHTSSLAGEDHLYDALFQRLGIARVATVTALLETLKLLALGGPLDGRRIASMSCSGGDAMMVADLAETRGLELPPLSPEHAARVRATLSELVDIGNPLDYHTFIWGDEPALTDCFSAMVAGGYDANLLVLDYPTRADSDLSGWQAAERAFRKATEAVGARGLVVSSLPECLPEAIGEALVAQGLIPMLGLDDCMTALACAAEIGEARRCCAEGDDLLLPPRSNLTGTARPLSEAESKARLAAFGLPVPAGRACSIEAAPGLADELGYPVVVKTCGEDLVHKTEAGGVAVGLRDRQAVTAAAKGMARLGDEVLVERMVEGAVAELIVGVTRDPQCGLALVIGAGGVLAELLVDSQALLLPTTRRAVEDAIARLRVDRLLRGYRGQAGGDRQALVDAVMALAAYAESEGERLVEIDVNPLLVRRDGQGVVAVDAVITLIEKETEDVQ
jgi:acyl-CoA synthetase (NDP forming)